MTRECYTISVKAKATLKRIAPANGFHSVTQDEMRQILDANARKLVHMSGDQALRAIRTSKRRDASASWTTIRMLASMLD
jgi:molybdenum cofactor biosynthesis enzyme